MSSNTESSGTPTYKEVEKPIRGQKYYYKNDTDNGVEYKESTLIFSEFNSAPGPAGFDDGGYYVYFMEDNPNRVRTSLYERVNGGGGRRKSRRTKSRKQKRRVRKSRRNRRR